MTTKVTVDAHAGWPVRVQALVLEYDHDAGEFTGALALTDLATVAPGTAQDFYGTDTRKIIVTELKNDC